MVTGVQSLDEQLWDEDFGLGILCIYYGDDINSLYLEYTNGRLMQDSRLYMNLLLYIPHEDLE